MDVGCFSTPQPLRWGFRASVPMGVWKWRAVTVVSIEYKVVCSPNWSERFNMLSKKFPSKYARHHLSISNKNNGIWLRRSGDAWGQHTRLPTESNLIIIYFRKHFGRNGIDFTLLSNAFISRQDNLNQHNIFLDPSRSESLSLSPSPFHINISQICKRAEKI